MKPSRGAGLIAAAALFVMASVPYLYAHFSTPADLVYTGLMFDVPDHAQYWSWVTASRSSLFISDTMTPEVNPAVFANPMMWVLGQLQLVFGLSFPTLFQWWRAMATLLVVPALVAFIRVMVPEPERRSTALVMALFGSGFGWLLVLGKRLTAAGDVPWPTDLYTVEPNTFWALLAYPHLSFAHALILVTVLGAWLAYRGEGWAYGAGAGVAAAVLSVSHAYDLITIYVVLAVYGLVIWCRERRFPSRLAVVGLVVGVCSGPAALYYQRLTSGDPLWRAILSQYSNAGVWTPPHVHLIVLMGLPLLLAAAGLASERTWSLERTFLATWALSGVCLVYLPVVYQVKLLSGWQFPLAILAAHAWHERVRPILERSMPRAWATALLVIVVSSTNVYLFAWRFLELRRHTAPYYLHEDEVQALDWLAQHSTSADVVLADPTIGQFVPNYGRSRAYLAHWAMTNRFFERRTNVGSFFDAKTPDSWRRALLKREGVTMVLRSDWPSTPEPAYDLARSSGFDLVFSSPHAQLYRVQEVPTAAVAMESASQ